MKKNKVIGYCYGFPIIEKKIIWYRNGYPVFEE